VAWLEAGAITSEVVKCTTQPSSPRMHVVGLPIAARNCTARRTLP